jgi:DNA-binding IclR family transcriptional regulator
MLQRRPCTAEDVAGAFGMHLNEVSKYLGTLTKEGQIRSEPTSGTFYYTAVIREGIGSYPRVNTVAKNAASASEDSGGIREEQSKSVPNKEAPFSG